MKLLSRISCRIAARAFIYCVVAFGTAHITLAQKPKSAKATASRPQIVGYFPQWGVYNHYFMGDLVRSGAASALTQLDYSQTTIANNLCTVADPQADLNLPYSAHDSVDGIADDPRAPLRGNFHQLQRLRTKYPRLHLLISIEGKRSSFEEAGKPENRVAFVKSCVDLFILGHVAPGIEAGPLFEGIDVDWEYPDPQHSEDFLATLAEFRRQLNAVRPGLLLSIASGAAQKQIDAVDWTRVAESVDQIGVMTYDYNGPWSRTTGLLAPLRSADLQAESVSATIAGYVRAGAPPAKLLLGLPFYAYEWNSVGASTTHGLGQSGSPVHGNLNQSTAKTLLAVNPEAHVYRDAVSQAPWIHDGEEFLTFEDPTSLREKMSYVREQKLGGVMIWELSGDTDDSELLHALTAAPSPPTAIRAPAQTPARLR